MKIQAYKLDIELIDQNEIQEGFRTGIVCAQYYNPDITAINGEPIDIKLVHDAPKYCSENPKTKAVVVIEQTKVTIRHQNDDI